MKTEIKETYFPEVGDKIFYRLPTNFASVVEIMNNFRKIWYTVKTCD